MRDDLTVLVQRIHPRADDFEIFEFFSQAGKVRDIRLIRDQRSGKSKGVGYVEFGDPASVMKALALNNIMFKGQPLLVQVSMAEKNRTAQQAKNVAAASALLGGSTSEPSKLVVSELNLAISQADVMEVFSPFGDIAEISMPRDAAGNGVGVANLTFVDPTCAKQAQAAIHGLELAGKKISVQLVADPPPQPLTAPPPTMPNMLGMAASMGMVGGAGMGVGLPGVSALPGAGGIAPPAPSGPAPGGEPSRFVRFTNFFDPKDSLSADDFLDLKEDVADECEKHGDVSDLKVVEDSAGHVLVKFGSDAGAAAAAKALCGRWFAGKQIGADFVGEEDFEGA